MHLHALTAGETLRLTTRQTFQLHRVMKHDLRTVIQGLHDVLLDTRAACGDDTRGVMCTVNPHLSELHAEVYGARQAGKRPRHPQDGCVRRNLVRRGARRTPMAPKSRSTGAPTCRESSRSASRSRPATTSTSISQDLGFIAIARRGKLEGLQRRHRWRSRSDRSGAEDLSAPGQRDRLHRRRRAVPDDSTR